MSDQEAGLAVVARAVVMGIGILLAGSIPVTVLFAANRAVLPAVPWAVIPILVYLSVFWRFLGGRWGSPETRESRRRDLRANALSPRVWVVVMVTGLIALVALVLDLRVVNRLVTLPTQQFYDVSGVSVVTILATIAVSALSAGIVEEAAFRGYLQGPIERRYGVVIAILVSGTFFGLLHVVDFTPILLPYYLAVAAIYGMLTRLADSILPSLALHTVGNIWSSSYLWRYGHAEWQATPDPLPLVWQAGADAGFTRQAAAAIVATVLTILAYRWLGRVARSGRTATA